MPGTPGWARGQTVTDPAHVLTAKQLREQFRQPPVRRAHDSQDGLVRDLADYDRAFGLAEGFSGNEEVA